MADGDTQDVADAHRLLRDMASQFTHMGPSGAQGRSCRQRDSFQEYMPRYAARDYERTGRIDNMVKNLHSAQDLAHTTRTGMPLTAVCAEVHRMLTSAGLGGEDQAALMQYFHGPRSKDLNNSQLS